MVNLLTIDVDASALLQALDRLGPAVESRVKEAARRTAEAIRNEATNRVRRRTGRTARGILVEESRDGKGYIVVATNPDMPGLPGWLETGTRYMTASPFLFNSARLEEGAHLRRIAEAVDDAIGEVGG